MNVGIITHYNVHNHGAVLQLYALEKVISQFGHQTKALQFNKNMDFLNKDASKKYNIGIKSIPYYSGYLIKKGAKKTIFNINKKIKLDKFKDNNKMIGGYYTDDQNLDCVFIGADEIFSIEPGLNPVFYGMGVPCKNIYSYAASFGPTTIDIIEKHNAFKFVQAGLNNLKKISVRDRNSLNIVNKVAGKNALMHCDPVILYDFESEKMNFKKNTNDERYVLVYAYDNNMNDTKEVESILKFARNNKLKVYSVGFYHKWADKNINVDPLELMNYIRDAEFVITDTFHGTVISIVMNTNFATKVRTNRNKLGFLLEEYSSLCNELHNFSVPEIQDIYERGLDVQKINNIINKKRKDAYTYLKECLESAVQ